MYPERELSRLAARKAVIRRDIAGRRAMCAQAARRTAEPLRWLDRALVTWRRISPLARLAMPLGLLAARPVLDRVKFVRPLLRWGPLAYDLVRCLRRAI